MVTLGDMAESRRFCFDVDGKSYLCLGSVPEHFQRFAMLFFDY
jgi:hypothetical protein